MGTLALEVASFIPTTSAAGSELHRYMSSSLPPMVVLQWRPDSSSGSGPTGSVACPSLQSLPGRLLIDAATAFSGLGRVSMLRRVFVI